MHLLQSLPIGGIAGIHGDGLTDVLQGSNLIIKSVICQGTEVIPVGIPVGAGIEDVQSFLEFAVGNIAISTLLILVAAILLTAVAAEELLKGVVAVGAVTALLTGLTVRTHKH